MTRLLNPSIQHCSWFVVCLSLIAILFCQPMFAQNSLALPVNQAPDDPTHVQGLTFDDLVFEMKKGESFKPSMLTPKIRQYDGATVRLRGYIKPSVSQSGLKHFVFVRDNQECCFGPGAALYDCVLVRLKKGEETDYTVRPVTIEGKLYLKTYKGPDGQVWSIYRMKNGRVK